MVFKNESNERRLTPANSFSILINVSTPSITICISSTSDLPKRSKLEMSNVPSVDCVSTPPKTFNITGGNSVK